MNDNKPILFEIRDLKKQFGDLEVLKGNAAEEYPDYLGQCASLDENLGRLVERLKKEGAIRSGLEVDVGITWSELAGSLLGVDKEGERLLGHVANEDLEDCLLCSNV